jgi:hypothetical protein
VLHDTGDEEGGEGVVTLLAEDAARFLDHRRLGTEERRCRVL